jgi:hypothetical protein
MPDFIYSNPSSTKKAQNQVEPREDVNAGIGDWHFANTMREPDNRL